MHTVIPEQTECNDHLLQSNLGTSQLPSFELSSHLRPWAFSAVGSSVLCVFDRLIPSHSRLGYTPRFTYRADAPVLNSANFCFVNYTPSESVTGLIFLKKKHSALPLFMLPFYSNIAKNSLVMLQDNTISALISCCSYRQALTPRSSQCSIHYHFLVAIIFNTNIHFKDYSHNQLLPLTLIDIMLSRKYQPHCGLWWSSICGWARYLYKGHNKNSWWLGYTRCFLCKYLGQAWAYVLCKFSTTCIVAAFSYTVLVGTCIWD